MFHQNEYAELVAAKFHACGCRGIAAAFMARHDAVRGTQVCQFDVGTMPVSAHWEGTKVFSTPRRSNMKTLTVAAPAPTTAPAASSSKSSSSTSTNKNEQNASSMNMWQGSKLIGLNVYDTQNEKIGDIKELMTDKDGKVEQVAIGVGGFLGMGEHDVAVKWGDLKFSDTPVPSKTSSSATGGAARTTGAASSTSSASSSTSTA